MSQRDLNNNMCVRVWRRFNQVCIVWPQHAKRADGVAIVAQTFECARTEKRTTQDDDERWRAGGRQGDIPSFNSITSGSAEQIRRLTDDMFLRRQECSHEQGQSSTWRRWRRRSSAATFGVQEVARQLGLHEVSGPECVEGGPPPAARERQEDGCSILGVEFEQGRYRRLADRHVSPSAKRVPGRGAGAAQISWGRVSHLRGGGG